MNKEELLNFKDYSNQMIDIIQAQVYFENFAISKNEVLNIIENNNSIKDNIAFKIANNLKEAWKFLFETYDLPLTTNYVLQLHKVLMDGLVDGNGYYRRRNIYVSGSRYIPPLLNPFQYDEMIQGAIKQNDILSAPALIAREQLFNDGNKRTATMLIQKELLKQHKLFNLTIDNGNEYKRALLSYYENKDKTSLEQFVKENTIYLL